MSFRQVMFYLGCAAAWFIALPVFVLGGGLALFIYAVFSEIGDFFIGGSHKSDTDAREMARLMCLR
jgi:hypothetical protein